MTTVSDIVMMYVPCTMSIPVNFEGVLVFESGLRLHETSRSGIRKGHNAQLGAHRQTVTRANFDLCWPLNQFGLNGFFMLSIHDMQVDATRPHEGLNILS